MSLPDVCAAPILRGPQKGQPATGTWAGYFRHKTARENLCDGCAAGMARYRKNTKTRKSVLPKPSRVEGPPLVRPRTEPEFVGFKLVVCQTCGRRGKANSKLVGKAHTIPACAECR